MDANGHSWAGLNPRTCRFCGAIEGSDKVRQPCPIERFVDVIIDSPNPEALDATLQSLGAVVVGIGEGGPVRQGEGWLVRVLDPAKVGFVEFACSTQGYGTWKGVAKPEASN